MLGTILRLQVSPHRQAVVLLVREYCHYKMSVPVTPRDRSAACLLILSLVQSPDLDLATSCKKYALDLHAHLFIVFHLYFCAQNQREGPAAGPGGGLGSGRVPAAG